jgi:oxygen-dependent protoporphyrinogen oxidase
LARLDVSFVVLERAPRAGGVIFSESIDGYTIDGGPDSLLVQKPQAIALCEELGLGDRLVATKPPRLAYIQRNRRLHPLPTGSVLGIPTRIAPFLETRLFSWPAKLRMGAELFVPPRRDEADESIGAFMTRRFGREATTYLAEPLLAGIHAGDVDRLSIRSLFPRFVEAEKKYGSLLRAFHTPTPSAHHGATPGAAAARDSVNAGAFKSLPGGLSEMIGALVRRLGEGTVRTGTTVARICRQPDDGAPREWFTVATAGGDTFNARAIVLATPAFVTSAIVRDHDAELARLCAETPYTSTATVVLAFPRDVVAHPLNGSGFVVPRLEDSSILAASWLSSKWPNRAPDDRVLMRTFFGGARDPHALDYPDAELVSRSLRTLGPLLGITGAPLFTRVYRWERASAQHEVGHLDRMAAVDRALARHPGLFVTGSGFRGVGIPDCVADGRATAAAVARWLKRAA